MSKRKTGTLVLLIVSALMAGLIVLMAGCSGGKPPEYSSSTSPIEVKVGEKFVISLESNPTTGYQWQLAEPLNTSILELVGSEYKAPETKLVGAGGEERWTFKAVGEGETKIYLEYARPWEKDVAPAKSETFSVIVR